MATVLDELRQMNVKKQREAKEADREAEAAANAIEDTTTLPVVNTTGSTTILPTDEESDVEEEHGEMSPTKRSFEGPPFRQMETTPLPSPVGDPITPLDWDLQNGSMEEIPPSKTT